MPQLNVEFIAFVEIASPMDDANAALTNASSSVQMIQQVGYLLEW
jgi:hypothetical protein